MFNKLKDNFTASKESHQNLLIYLAIVLVSLACFANSLTGKFIYDDYLVVVDNTSIKSLNNIPDLFLQSYFGKDNTAGTYRPLTTISFAINYAIAGLEPYSYHLANIIINAINSLLVYWIVKYYSQSKLLGIFTALLFSVHPVHSEAVAAIYGRPELLATMFLLIAWVCYEKSPANKYYYLISLLSYFLSLLCKESGIVFFGILLLIQFCTKTSWKEKLIPTPKSWGYVLTTIPYLIIRIWITGAFGVPKSGQMLGGESFSTRVYTMSFGYIKYFQMLVWPSKLYTEYDFSVIPKITSVNFTVVLSLVTILLIIIIGFWQTNKNRIIVFGILFFFVATSIVSNVFLPTGILISERTIYLAVGSICLLMGAAFYKVYKMGWTKFALGFFIFTLLLVSIRTYYRNLDFQNDEVLFSSTLKIQPNHFKANYCLGLYYENIGQADKAEVYLKKALQLNETSSIANVALANFYNKQAKVDLAINLFKRAIELDPNNADAHSFYGAILLSQGNLCTAKEHLTKALSINKNLVKAHNNLGVTFAQMNRYQEAKQEFEKTLELDPNYQGANENLYLLKNLEQNSNPPINCP
ncbi:MAG: tetratricopeptide repeat protein [Blastocatellia bacterium]